MAVTYYVGLIKPVLSMLTVVNASEVTLSNKASTSNSKNNRTNFVVTTAPKQHMVKSTGICAVRAATVR